MCERFIESDRQDVTGIDHCWWFGSSVTEIWRYRSHGWLSIPHDHRYPLPTWRTSPYPYRHPHTLYKRKLVIFGVFRKHNALNLPISICCSFDTLEGWDWDCQPWSFLSFGHGFFSPRKMVGDWINSRITNGEAELCFDAFALKNIIVKVTRGQLSRCLGVFVFRLNHGILVGMDSINGKQK